MIGISILSRHYLIRTKNEVAMLKRNPDITKLGAGDLSGDCFDIIVGLTSIRSEPLIKALRGFYVEGISKSESCKKQSLDLSSFSRKIERIDLVFNMIISFNKKFEE
jgi:hypothetical protein